MSEWTRTTLDQLVKLRRGHDLPTTSRNPGNVPVVGAAGPSGFHDTAIAKAPGVVVGRAGASMGHATYCAEDFWPLNTSLYVTDFMGNDPRFVYHLLGEIDFSGYNSGAAQPMLNRNYITQIPISLPEPDEQRAIAAVLGALDDKIVVNERIVAAAMELGAAKAAQVSASAMESAVLGDILELKYGKSLPAARRVAGEIPVFGSGGISGTHIEALLEGPGIIVGRKGTVGSVYWSEGGFFPIDTTFYVVCRGNGVSMEYAYFLLKGLGLEEMNSDSAVPGLNRDRALSVRIKVPDAHSIQRFTVEARELFAMSRVREQENQTLATLRDTLLPQLMSGRIRVKDAEKIVEDHV
ncbi:restriction endonuclease subunit S [Streptomyces sp. NRRL S-340]|uniref:restriction endonuclease subunit S n=1 Tax=Streptomyces sp. NRRL S-340 TaxID=1463901 RepID=UPI00099D128D|nr:restriction endonuclease subunit S [Streptomyces sp. NRRL S-340]